MPTKADIFTLYPEVAIYLRLILREYKPNAVWLIGSKARGDAGPASDADFIVFADHPIDQEAITGNLDIWPASKVPKVWWAK